METPEYKYIHISIIDGKDVVKYYNTLPEIMVFNSNGEYWTNGVHEFGKKEIIFNDTWVFIDKYINNRPFNPSTRVENAIKEFLRKRKINQLIDIING